MAHDAAKYDTDAFATEKLVYIKRLDAETVSELVAPNALAEIDNPGDLFAVYGPNGEPLAIVEGREAAFAAARAHELKPASVH